MEKTMFFVCLIFLFSCKPTSNQNDIEGLVGASLKNLNITAKVKSEEIELNDKTALMIDVLFINNYYVQKNTNDVVFSYVMSNMDKQLDKYDEVQFGYHYNDLSDLTVKIYSQLDIKELSKALVSNQLYIELIRYTFSNTNTNDVIGFNEMIKDINRAFPEYKYERDFWSLLLEYSKTCCLEDDFISIYYDHMILLAERPGHEWKPILFKKLKEICTLSCKDSVSQ